MSHVLVLLAPGFEDLEAVTITDLLVRAGIEVITAGLDQQPVTASRGTRVTPDTTLDAVLDNQYDMIALPGGQPGADNLQNDPRVISLLKKHANSGKYIAAICAAPKILEHANLLDDMRATSFPGVLKKTDNTSINITDDAVVVDKNIITSRGPGTAIDFALKLIELLEGKEKMIEVETQLVRY